MSDPTGAAQTALAKALMAESNQIVAEQDGPYGEPMPLPLPDLTPFYRLADAVLAHLAEQAGPEVRGLVEEFEREVRALQSTVPENLGAYSARLSKARTTLLAAYEALRQQRDEAVRWRSITQPAVSRLAIAMGNPAVHWYTDKQTLDSALADFAVGRMKELEAEAATERQRADTLRDWFIETIYETENNPAMTVAELLRRMRHVMDDPELNKPSQ